MTIGIRLPDKDVAERLEAAFAVWKMDAERGMPALRPFGLAYSRRRHLRMLLHRRRTQGTFRRILRRCSEELQAFWCESRRWSRAWRIHVCVERVRRAYGIFLTDHSPNKQWCRRYIRMSSIDGRSVLNFMNRHSISLDVVVRCAGSRCCADWRPSRERWDEEKAQRLFLAALRAYLVDRECGQPTGRTFNGHYLKKRKHHALLVGARVHCRGGIQVLARRIPEVRAYWHAPAPLPTRSATAEKGKALFKVWRRHPIGRRIGMPFGQTFARLLGESAFASYVDRHGAGWIFSGDGLRVIREHWGYEPPGTHTREAREKRAAAVATWRRRMVL